MDYIHNVWDMDNHDYSNNRRIVESPLSTFWSSTCVIYLDCQQECGFCVCIAFEFEEYVIVFLTQDFLIQVHVMHFSESCINLPCISLCGQHHLITSWQVLQMFVQNGSCSCKVLPTGFTLDWREHPIRQDKVDWPVKRFAHLGLSGVVLVYILSANCFLIVVCGLIIASFGLPFHLLIDRSITLPNRSRGVWLSILHHSLVCCLLLICKVVCWWSMVNWPCSHSIMWSLFTSMTCLFVC